MNPSKYTCPTCQQPVDEASRCWNRACPDWGIERFLPTAGWLKRQFESTVADSSRIPKWIKP